MIEQIKFATLRLLEAPSFLPRVDRWMRRARHLLARSSRAMAHAPFVCLFVAVALLVPISVKAEDKQTIYFFNQEANINNFASLKLEFDTYFSGLGGYQLQPFNDSDIFEKTVALKKDGVLLLSSWHYKKLKEQLSLKAVLVGVLNGKTTQKKVLSAKKVADTQGIRAMKVASAGSKEYTRNILEEMFGSQGNEFAIMPVPKDIDALMAVGFGMATAALTSENSLSNLENINLKQYQQLKQIGKSGEKFLMIAAIPEDTEAGNAPLLGMMVKMGATTEGENKLRMLGLQGFRALSATEKEALSK